MIIDILITNEQGKKFKHTIAYQGHIDREDVRRACEKSIEKLFDLSGIK